MPIPIKVTFFFELTPVTGSGGVPLSPAAGWTETYFGTVSAFTDAVIAGAVLGPSGAVTIQSKRWALLPWYVICPGIRVTDMTNPRSSLFYEPTTPGPNGVFKYYPRASGGQAQGNNFFPLNGQYGRGEIPNFNNVQPSEVDTAVRVKMQDASGRHRRVLLLRGLPEHIIGFGGAYLSSQGTWRPAMDAWLQLLSTGPTFCQLRVLSLIQPAGQQILSITLEPGDFRALNLTVPAAVQKVPDPPQTPQPPPANIAVGDTVVVRGVKGSYRVNGYWRVQAILPASGAVQYTLGPHRRNLAIPPTVPAGATLSYATWVFPQVVFADDTGLIVYERRTGRPFDLLHGQHKAK